MRLCAALALVLVALVVLTVKAARRHPRHAPVEADAAEVAPPQAAQRPLVPRPPARAVAAPVVPARIVGRLRLPDDVGPARVKVVARASGGPRWDQKGRAGEDGFRIEDLVAGRRYDLEFRGNRIRTLRMVGVVAPAEDLDVELEARATIHLAVGFPRGGRCPVDSIFAHVGGDDGSEGFGIPSFDEDCRFDFDAPVSVGLVTIVAEGDGVRFEGTVVVPDHGDPDPLCLNPPCRANPVDGLARLRFILDGAARDSAIIADVRAKTPGASESYGCRSSTPTCEIEGVLPGEFSIDVVGPGCGADSMTISVVAGDNEVSVPCLAPESREEKPGAENPDPAPADDGA
jgi:hypothetical protein